MITAAPFIKAEKPSCCANSSRTWGYYNRESLNLFSLDYAGGKGNCLILAHSWSPLCCLGEKHQSKGETAWSMARGWGRAAVSTWDTSGAPWSMFPFLMQEGCGKVWTEQLEGQEGPGKLETGMGRSWEGFAVQMGGCSPCLEQGAQILLEGLAAALAQFLTKSHLLPQWLQSEEMLVTIRNQAVPQPFGQPLAEHQGNQSMGCDPTYTKHKHLVLSAATKVHKLHLQWGH